MHPNGWAVSVAAAPVAGWRVFCKHSENLRSTSDNKSLWCAKNMTPLGWAGQRLNVLF